MSGSHPGDDEPTDVRPQGQPPGSASPGSGPPAPAAPPPGGAPPPAVPPGEDKPAREGVAAAVWTGVKDAGAPMVRFLDVVGGHLILVGRALAWLPRR
ncbi:MAG: hypothetical protein AB7L28_28575, partial [Kofleriaceae bacterium]